MAREITLNHICKIEGHAHLHLEIDNNVVKTCELKAAEGARFFEALVVGKEVGDVQEIVSRICGICSSAHTVASIIGLEKALGIKPTKEQIFIREMLMTGERIRSHATHLYFLSLPDYLGAPSVLELGPTHKSKIDDALSIITVGNKLVEVFGGREMHPFLKIKEEQATFDTEELIKKLQSIKPIILRTIQLFQNLDYPKLSRETDYLSLSESKEYAITNGNIKSHTGIFEEEDYKKHLVENIKEYATSKFVLKEKKPYMLGAMARINNNHALLDEESKKELHEWMKKNNLSFPLYDPHHNLVCQAIELLEAVNRAVRYIGHAPKKDEIKPLKIKEGVGVSAVEAPRGTLFHEYKIDEHGKIAYCNIITPTAQNLNMMEEDIKRRVNDLLVKKASKQVIVADVEKLIRAYDPCFSCSTHFLEVSWKGY